MSKLEQKLIENFGSYKDFPKPGIVFCDILPILTKPISLMNLLKICPMQISFKNQML